MKVDDKVDLAFESIDADGRDLTLAEWVEMLERVIAGCRERIDAAREDMSRG